MQKIPLGVLVVFLVLFVACGGFLLMLYNVPSFMPWGMHGIVIKSKYMHYKGDEVIHILKQRNMVIESTSADVNIYVRKPDWQGSGITVYEDANGVTFNSVLRTQVGYMETIDKETGEAYTKIYIREPDGAIIRTCRVEINLISENIGVDYKFVLNTGKSKVTFSRDNDTAESEIGIEKMTINGTGNVNIIDPVNANRTVGFDIGELLINSPSANVDLRGKTYTPVEIGDVIIKRNSSKIILDRTEDLTITGDDHDVSVTTVAGNVNYNCTLGELNISDVTGNVMVRGKEANNAVFQRATGANINIQNIIGYFDIDTKAGNVIIGGCGNAKVIMDNGSLRLGNASLGVRGWVDVKKDRGGVEVICSTAATTASTVKIHVITGDITARRIMGKCDIQATSMGNTNAKIEFANIVTESVVAIWGERERNTDGNLTIVLGNIKTRLHAVGATQFWDKVTPSANELDVCPVTNHDVIPGTDIRLKSGAGCHLEPINPRGNTDGAILNLRTRGILTIQKTW